MMFDIDGARQAGYTDAEIARHLAGQSGFDYDGAASAGYTDADILQHLAGQQERPTDPRQPDAPGFVERIRSGFASSPSGQILKANLGVTAGAWRGVKDMLDTGAQALASGAERVAPQAMAGEADRIRQMNEADKRGFDEAGHGIPGAIGRAAGNAIGAAPVLGGVGAAIGAVPRLSALGQAVSTLGGGPGGLATRIAGGAAGGALAAGVVNPGEAGVGAAIGGAIPAVGAAARFAGRPLGAMSKWMTPGGRDDIVRNILTSSTADESAVRQALASPKAVIAPQTFTQLANDPGISSLQRHLVNRSQDFAGDLAIREAGQNSARFGHLYGMSGGPAGIEAVKQMREQVTRPLLDAALQGADDVGTMGVRAAVKGISQSPAFQRKAVRSAVREAAEPFATQGADGAKAWARKVPFETAWGARQNIDDILAGASRKVNDKAARAASSQLAEIRKRLSASLERASPDFKAFGRTYASESRKVDAAETLYDLVKTASTGARDMHDNPVLSGAMLDRALKNMEPKKWAALSAQQRSDVAMMVDELTTAARVKTLGSAIKSDTAQNFMQPDSMPLLLRAASGLSPSGSGMFGAALDFAMRGAQNRVQGTLGQALLDPAIAARYYQPITPSLAAQLTPVAGGAARRLAPIMPATVAPTYPLATRPETR
jgi:hypothetical protein